MENPVEKIRINRRASRKKYDDINTIELEMTLTITDPVKIQESVKKVVSEMRDIIDDEKTWSSKNPVPTPPPSTVPTKTPAPASKPTPAQAPASKPAPASTPPPSGEPITLGRKNYLSDLMKNSFESETKIKQWLAKFGKPNVGDLSNQQAIQILDDVVGPRKSQ